jgi:phosphonate transport system permease protein
MGAIASGEADYGAILWENWGPSRRHPVAKAYRPKCEIAFTTEHYSGVKVVNGEIQRALAAARIPVAMAIVGTLLGVFAAMVLCYAHSIAFQMESRRFTGESPTILQMIARWANVVLSRIVALISRGVPEIMWAMFFVAFFGMGVVAGVAALAIHTMGLMIRVFGETVDNIPYRRFEQAFGGSRLATFTYAAAPISWRDWMTYSFFQFESNVRAGVVLGIIGSTGLGFIFSFNFEHFKLEKASTDLLVIIMLTIVIDRMSRALKLTRVRA